tara:strand:+ start:4869 stop:5042 length:174 start_codon:yes stop_codon:yes gene_type:complete
MEDVLTVSKDVHSHLAKLQSEMDELRDTINDLTLSADDLAAIRAGQQDFKEERTRRL